MSNRSTAKDETRGRAGPSLHGRPPPRPVDLTLPDEEVLSEPAAPPLPGKVHPPAEMSDATPTLDDEVRGYHHHPNEVGTTEFGFDPEAADAAADLAGDLGSQFLEGATRGEDISDRMVRAEEEAEVDVSFLLEEETELTEGVATEDEGESEAPAPRRRRRGG